MPMIYKPNPNRHDAPVNRDRCKAAVHDTFGVGFHQCLRMAGREGWCFQHHPDAEKEREAKKRRDYEEQQRKLEARRRTTFGRGGARIAGRLEFWKKRAQRCSDALVKIRDLMKTGSVPAAPAGEVCRIVQAALEENDARKG